MGVVQNERYYNGAAITDADTTVGIAALATVPGALGDTADRAEVETKLAALEAHNDMLATKLNFVLSALEDAGLIVNAD